jgi:hypothetical protein
MASIKTISLSDKPMNNKSLLKLSSTQTPGILNRRYSQLRITRTILEKPIAKPASKNPIFKVNLCKSQIFNSKISPITLLKEPFIEKKEIYEFSSLISFKKG